MSRACPVTNKFDTGGKEVFLGDRREGSGLGVARAKPVLLIPRACPLYIVYTIVIRDLKLD